MSMASGTWHMAVLIPARNEEAMLPRCLHSVAVARAALPPHITSDVVVISDGSTDRSVHIARSLLGSEGVALETQAGGVGIARALAANVALTRNRNLLSRCWLANTDADCEVPPAWLLDHLRIATNGYAAVAGIVDVQDFSEHLPHVQERFRATYFLERDGSHPHVHGANMGVRADAYLLAGGWAPLETAEDHDLWKRLRRGAGPHLSDATLQVLTSGRRVGRAPHGFAAALAAHNGTAATA